MHKEWLSQRIESALEDRRTAGLLRFAQAFRHLSPTLIELDGQRLINFGSNDYLGVTSHPSIRSVMKDTNSSATISENDFARWGSGASPLVTGRTVDHDQLEIRIAKWKRTDSAITFSSGYATNVSVIAALAKSNDTIFSDQLNHASLIDGCRLSDANVVIYPHADIERLEMELKIAAKRRQSDQGFWIVTDSVFSMEGDCIDVTALVDLASRYDASLIIDEAHAVGVYGDRGQGLADFETIRNVPLISIGTCSKALGSIGGYVCANQPMIEYLRQFARGYVYSTAMPALAVRATCVAIDVVEEMQIPREQLRKTATEFRKKLCELGLTTQNGDSPICPIYETELDKLVKWSKSLRQKGFFVPAIRPPTVPIGKGMLRVSLSAAHSQIEVQGLLDALSETL